MAINYTVEDPSDVERTMQSIRADIDALVDRYDELEITLEVSDEE